MVIRLLWSEDETPLLKMYMLSRGKLDVMDGDKAGSQELL
jgi:hypothetical protein